MHSLPPLPYAYDALEPYYDKVTLELHHSKHHQAYVDGLNSATEKRMKARETGDYSGLNAVLKDLAFHGSGHYLHSLFWENLAPEGQGADGQLDNPLLSQINTDFGSLDVLIKEFTAAAVQVEGSGWAVLGTFMKTKQLAVHQIEKHQDLALFGTEPILVCDMWEHAYYLKYKNRRAEWLDNFWHIVNWNVVSERYEKI